MKRRRARDTGGEGRVQSQSNALQTANIETKEVVMGGD